MQNDRGKSALKEVDTLRSELDELDRSLIALVARRQEIVREIGRAKSRKGRATRDFSREREVLVQVRGRAIQHGVRPEVAEAVYRSLIAASLEAQEQDRVARSGRGRGRAALVIGGAGTMGLWFARFLDSQGWYVEVADSNPVSLPFRRVDWERCVLDHELVVVSTPLAATDAVLRELARRKPTGLVFDLGSLKSPLQGGLQALVDAGVRATSIHPMFGGDTQLLSGRHVVFCELGCAGAVAEAKQLFADTMAVVVDMTLEEHDRAIAFVLGLSHALNITFFTALAGSGEQASRLAQLSSTTFDAQLDVARRVASENEALYFDIQALNAFGMDALDSLVAAASAVREKVAAGDSEGFGELMKDGRAWFAHR
jgi:chorismate mutase / prephenate dehydrogenase